jgi:transcriptional regulator with XRE-family HTH domain
VSEVALDQCGTRPNRHARPSTQGERLRLAMLKRGMCKLSAMACSVGVSESAISRWRSGGAMTLSNVAAVCNALDISADWLVLGRGDMNLHRACHVLESPDLARSVSELSPQARIALHRFLRALVEQ